MADVTPQKRVLPARERRESAAKRRASSPPKPLPTPTPAKTSLTQPASEPRQKRKYTKRASLLNISKRGRRTSTPISTADEAIPTRFAISKPLPTSALKQSENVSAKEYQSIADSAILAASLHRSRMQWLCDGIFDKYWTKPMKRKGVEAPANNPDVKSMTRLGNATITIEPHTFDATFYTVRDFSVPSQPVYRHPNQHTVKQTQQHAPSTPKAVPAPVPPAKPFPLPQTSPDSSTANIKSETSSQPPAQQHKAPTTPSVARPSATPVSNRPPTPPGGAKTTDPVIQMLAARAATDNHLKELMKVVATSRASPDQLREFQAHIDEFNAIVKRQEMERERQAKERAALQTTPAAAHPQIYNSGVARGAAPSTHSPYPSYQPPPPPPPRMEPVIKHIIIEFTSSAASQQPASSDRWLFPEHAVLDMRYNATEMTCSFFAERKGSDIPTAIKANGDEGDGSTGQKWEADKEYYQPVTMTIKASHPRTIETIARSAKSLAEVHKYMKEVMETKTRASEEYLVHQLLREKQDPSVVEFVDSAVELSGAEEDELKDFYGIESIASRQR